MDVREPEPGHLEYVHVAVCEPLAGRSTATRELAMNDLVDREHDGSVRGTFDDPERGTNEPRCFACVDVPRWRLIDEGGCRACGRGAITRASKSTHLTSRSHVSGWRTRESATVKWHAIYQNPTEDEA